MLTSDYSFIVGVDGLKKYKGKELQFKYFGYNERTVIFHEGNIYIYNLPENEFIEKVKNGKPTAKFLIKSFFLKKGVI